MPISFLFHFQLTMLTICTNNLHLNNQDDITKLLLFIDVKHIEVYQSFQYPVKY
jgi:hypothetical protein